MAKTNNTSFYANWFGYNWGVDGPTPPVPVGAQPLEDVFVAEEDTLEDVFNVGVPTP